MISNNHLSLYRVITILIIFLTLYITSLWLTYYVTGGWYLLIAYTYFALPPSLSSLLATTCLFSEPMSLFLFLFCLFVLFFDSTCKWDHVAFLFLWLISLSIISSRFIHVFTNGKIFSFLWLSNSPLCVCACVCHIFFIHLSIDGYLGFFCILAIINNASINIKVHISFQIGGFVFFR